MSNIAMKMRESGNTPISNDFIDSYMLKANPVYSILYIYGLRKCSCGCPNITTGEIMKSLNILESDVHNAWKYWQSQGLVSVSGDGLDLSLEFLPVPQKAEEPVLAPKQQAQQAPKQQAPKQEKRLGTKKTYDPEELEFYKTSKAGIQEIFEKAEEAMRSCLHHEDLAIVYSLYDWLGLPLDVIKCLLEYCSKRGIKSSRYIEKVGMNWAESNVTSIEEAEAHLRNYERPYRETLRAMGLNANYPTESQKNFIDRWLIEFNMPLEVVKDAISKATYRQGTATFPYINGILKRWSDAGIRTLAECASQSATAPASATPGKRSAPATKSKFSNFAQHDYDFELIAKLDYESNLKFADVEMESATVG
ncbi:MAG: DnaD domain protein [Clostridiales bacterium]|jgi:DnaD/phage-associated family protein|nr:DnaD domain protein [Clostridiales bacterium]MDR2750224.1 DnaD domain protein [Clostridiales bacterium]